MKYFVGRFIVQNNYLRFIYFRHVDERKRKDMEESVEESISNNEQDVELQVSEDSGDGESTFH